MTLDDQIADTTWEHTVRLAPGNNTFSVRQQDDHENVSEALILDIRYEDGPPVPLTNATAESLASGTSLLFSWNYDESASGDIKGYHVFWSSRPFPPCAVSRPEKLFRRESSTPPSTD